MMPVLWNWHVAFETVINNALGVIGNHLEQCLRYEDVLAPTSIDGFIPADHLITCAAQIRKT